MKVAAAQIRSKAGDIAYNLNQHLRVVERAIELGLDLVAFPELSLTGYEPTLARELAHEPDDPRFAPLQSLCDKGSLVVACGVPLRVPDGVQIGLLWFQPSAARQTYSKLWLHADEVPYFVPGCEQRIFNWKGRRIAPAICYESLQRPHAEHAARLGADIYLATVAKSATGIAKARNHNPQIARDYRLTVVMANSTGPADTFLSAGGSAIWNLSGDCVAHLGDTGEHLVWYDLESRQGNSQELKRVADRETTGLQVATAHDSQKQGIE